MAQLQYIYNTSTSTYFEDEFNITLSNDSEIEMKFRVLNYNSVWDGRLFICGSPYHDGYAQFQQYSQIRCGFQSFGEKYTTVQDPSAIHIVNVSKNGYYVDGESLGTLSGSASVQGTGFGINATQNMELEIYYITIKENGVMAHNYVGWEGNGVVGLKDMVTNVFYTPTSGSYTAGPAVVETPVIPVNKYKFYTMNVLKTYEGSSQINKMYVGGNLVYQSLIII